MNTALTFSPKIVRLRRSDPPIRPTVATQAVRTSAAMVSETVSATPAPRPPIALADNVIPAAPVTLPAKKTNVAEHPLAQHALTALRNKHTRSAEFRQISNQLLVLLALEATRNLATKDELIETHTTTHTGQSLAKPVIFLSITRHGLGLAHNVADFFPGMLVGTISLGRKGDQAVIEPRLHIANAPALSDAQVILFDPVVTTGMSATLALNFIRRSGATDISLVSFLMSFAGLSRLQTALPNLSVWTAGIDSEWDSKKGPMPGLGNFGERLYG